MKNSVETIEITANGKTVTTTPEQLKEAAKNIGNEIAAASSIIVEAKGQIDNLLTSYAELIYKTYKSNANELKVAIAISLEGNSQDISVHTKLTFNTGKVTDEMQGLIQLKQIPLPGVK